jgi:IPT/TIG domain
MSLGKRHIGRRVAGIGVAVALMMVGLAAPAFAAAPVISSFTPDSGIETGGCIVVVTGTGLDDFAVATWQFVPTTAGATVQATDFVGVSDTEAWVAAPDLALGLAYNIKVTNAGGTNTSTGTFLATASAGNCAPTITSITPNCGSHNTKVVIAGTNLLRDFDGPAELAPGDGDIAGGLVQFTPFSDDAAVVPPDSDTSTTLTRFVSTNAADGPVKVVAGGGTGFSGPSFEVPPPDCTAAVPTAHARSISFKIKSTGKASGVVKSTEDPAFTDCVAAVPVKIQKKTSSGWKTVGKATTTDTGSYTKKVKNPKGKQKFRALAPKVSLGDPVTDTCTKAKSATRKV